MVSSAELPRSCVAPTDAELVAAALAGDRDAFAAVAERHRRTAESLAARMLGDAHLAGDAAQEAVVIAMLSLDRLRAPDRFGAWLCGIALNVARGLLRESARTRGPTRSRCDELVAASADSHDPALAAEAAATAERVRRAVLALPPGQREAVLRFYWLGLSHAEVAAELGISVGAVKARLHQARTGLAPRLWRSVRAEDDADEEEAAMTEPQWVDVTVAEVRRAADDDAFPSAHVVVLRAGDGRELPIWTAQPEAVALALSLEGAEMPRPMTYQLGHSLLGATGGRIDEVRVTALAESTFYAVVVVSGPGGRHEVDARPSDGLNLALVAGAPVRVEAGLFDVRGRCETDWHDYATTAAELAVEVRERQEAFAARLAEVRGSEPPSPG